jgi:hypothetical protein
MNHNFLFFSDNVFLLFLNVVNILNPTVDEGFLWQEGLENNFPVFEVVTVEIFSLNFFNWRNILAV